MRDLLGQTIAEQAERGPLIVLLDEVETLAADRGRMSMDANPIDVHRATDAVLAQLDQLAAKYPHLLFIATSNFTRAVDGAFCGIVEAEFKKNVLDGQLFLFVNRRRDRIKALWWESGGLTASSRDRPPGTRCVPTTERRSIPRR